MEINNFIILSGCGVAMYNAIEMSDALRPLPHLSSVQSFTSSLQLRPSKVPRYYFPLYLFHSWKSSSWAQDLRPHFVYTTHSPHWASTAHIFWCSIYRKILVPFFKFFISMCVFLVPAEFQLLKWIIKWFTWQPYSTDFYYIAFIAFF